MRHRWAIVGMTVLLTGPVQAQTAKPKARGAKPVAAPSPKAPTPEPPPPPGWKVGAYGGKVTVQRPSEELDANFVGLRYGITPDQMRAHLIVSCGDGLVGVRVQPAGTPNVGRQDLLLRLDQEKAFKKGSPDLSIYEAEALPLVKSFLAHHWLLVRYTAENGYHEHTFNLAGLDAALTPLETRCGLPPGTVSAAAAGRPAVAPPAPPAPTDIKETTVGGWKVSTRVNRFDDSRTVVLSVPAAAPMPGQEEPARLVLRVLDRNLDVYVTTSTTIFAGSRLALRFDDGTSREFAAADSGDYSGVFLLPAKRVLREMARHKTVAVPLEMKGGVKADAVFPLEGLTAAAAPLVEAAGLPGLGEPPRAGRWRELQAEEKRAALILDSESGGDRQLLVTCEHASLGVAVAARSVTDKDAQNNFVAFGSAKPQKGKLSPAADSTAALAPGARVLSFALDKEAVGELLRNQRFTVRFGKSGPDAAFDVTGLATWLEALEDAGCAKELTGVK